MVKRGQKPSAPHLRLVTGQHRDDRHGDVGEVRKATAAAAATFGKPVCPTYLRGEARTAWRMFIAPADWLDASREPSAIAFCELWQEFRTMPARFTAARHAQMRAYMGELGLTDPRDAAPQKRRRPMSFSMRSVVVLFPSATRRSLVVEIADMLERYWSDRA